MRGFGFAVLVGLMLATTPLPATADETDGLKVCNQSEKPIGVALGYKAENGWQSKGWTPIAVGGCETVLTGQLVERHYYLYATDETGGAWQGRAFLCSRGRDFTILGTEDCLARGYSRTPFFEIETLGAKAWTVLLRGSNALYAATPPLTSAWIQTRPEDAAPYQLYEIVTTASPSAPLSRLLGQSGAVGWERRAILNVIDAYVGRTPRAIASELRVWFRQAGRGGIAQRLSFYDNGKHVVTVVRNDRGRFVLGIDPGR
jgi:uncharacterized membrane protein